MVLQPIRLPATALTGADAVRLRSDVVDSDDAEVRALDNLRPAFVDQAVVVRFGAQALSLARSALTANTDADAPSVDTEESSIGPQPSRANAADELLANAFGPNEATSALLGALDSNLRRALPPPAGALDREPGLFGDEPSSALESGFFRSSSAATRESFLGRQALGDGFESTFPRAPANNTLESGFPLALASDALESSFPRPAASSNESGFFPLTAAANGESGLFRSREATATESTFPRAPAADAEQAALFAAPGANPAETGLLDLNRAATAPPTPFRTEELSSQQQREIQTLAQNERQVRAAQQAQRAAAGGYAAGAQLRYELGPDGRRYVVSADVPLDVSPVPGDPAATLRKMEVIQRAATSGNPSISDRNAAAEAGQLARRARAQLAAERYAEAQEF